MDEEISCETLRAIADNAQECGEILAASGVCSAGEIARRAASLKGCASIHDGLERANIRYFAPADAASTGLPPASVDIVYSVAVFEHIGGAALRDILSETARILTTDGLTVHIIDLSDHFSHTDGSITTVNFLRYSDAAWDFIAGNSFAYCNRLRASEYASLFQASELEMLSWDAASDGKALEALKTGRIKINPRFGSYTFEDLASVSVEVVARAAQAT